MIIPCVNIEFFLIQEINEIHLNHNMSVWGKCLLLKILSAEICFKKSKTISVISMNTLRNSQNGRTLRCRTYGQCFNARIYHEKPLDRSQPRKVAKSHLFRLGRYLNVEARFIQVIDFGLNWLTDRKSSTVMAGSTDNRYQTMSIPCHERPVPQCSPARR